MPIHTLSPQHIADRPECGQPALKHHCNAPAAHISARIIIAPQAITLFHLARALYPLRRMLHYACNPLPMWKKQ